LIGKRSKMNIKIIVYQVLVFTFYVANAMAQTNTSASINLVTDPANPKNAVIFDIQKTQKEIVIRFKKVDSIGKINLNENDLATIKRLMGKDANFFDSLTHDSLTYFQQKLDSIRKVNTYYKIDSTTIFKSTHNAYWQFLDKVLATPNAELERKQEIKNLSNTTFCFFKIKQYNQERNVYIESLEPKMYPILVKLINDTQAIMDAHRFVMERKRN
jgi:hypothetical protein